MPSVCIGEARQAIMAKCQPRHEANALRRFLSFSEPAGDVTKADAVARIAAKPFDHAILAGVLVGSSRLWATGERGVSFCEADADLQPWDKIGNEKPLLAAAYNEAHVWVYGDFTLAQSPRGFE